MKETYKEPMEAYQTAINEELASYSRSFIVDTLEEHGSKATIPIEAYGLLLSRGGKRLRGALTIVGYEMLGGQDSEMILQAACAVEMMHAYILIIDDIQDRSDVRRGGPTVHRLLEQKSRDNNWIGDHAHVGRSLALNAALAGGHYASRLIGELNAPAELRIKAKGLLDSTMIKTAYGQTIDIINEVNGEVTREDINQVILLKTAYYSLLNPLQIGMILAGCSDEDLEAIESFAEATGQAYQITDDLLAYSDGPFDKDPSTDIKDRKQTLILYEALKRVKGEDEVFLRRCLGSPDLTEANFKRCVAIVVSTGAVAEARAEAKAQLEDARNAAKRFPKHWDQKQVSFLMNLTGYILNRTM